MAQCLQAQFNPYLIPTFLHISSITGGKIDFLRKVRSEVEHTYPLLICTWFLKNQFWKIKFDKLDFQSISNWIFTACVACKNQFQNWFLQVKNPVGRTWFFKLDFSDIKYRSTGGKWLSVCFCPWGSLEMPHGLKVFLVLFLWLHLG